MSYVVPSPMIYQQLESSGGVLNSTPDLQACIIGPAYNVLKYVPGSVSSMITTSAQSSVIAVGATENGSDTITFTAYPPFSVGDTIFVPGGAADGSVLSGTILEVGTLTTRLNVKAGRTVSGVVITRAGVIADSTITNTFNLPGQKPGQELLTDSVEVYLNNAKVETIATTFSAFPGESSLQIHTAAGTADITSGSETLTNVSSAEWLTVGDNVIVSGAGAGGADLKAKVIQITGSNVTLDTDVAATDIGVDIIKAEVEVVDQSTFTLRLESGDSVEVSYKDATNTARVLDSVVGNVIAQGGSILGVNLYDRLPADAAVTTTGTTTAGSDILTLTTGGVLAEGDVVKVDGAGVGGTDLIAKVTTVDGVDDKIVTLDRTAASAVVGASIAKQVALTVRSRKVFNNQLLPRNRPDGSGANYDVANAATTGEVEINPNPYIPYGLVKSANVHFAYRALRKDLSGSVGTISSPDDIRGIFTEVSELNPLALGVQIAQANTISEVKFIAVESDDLQGYLGALDLSEGERLYSLVPLTQDLEILTAFKAHVEQMSVPEEAMWRMSYVNTKIPTTQSVGIYNENFVNANGGDNTITVINGKFVLSSSNSTFMSDGMVPGDSVFIVSGTGAGNFQGTAKVLEILNNQQVVLDVDSTATAVTFYAFRSLSKAQQAAHVAATSRAFGTNRIVHVQSDLAGIAIDGVTKYLPGYYFCCALAGMTAGFPVQQGFTNIGLAGIADVQHSNFYFTRAQLGVMAEAGTLLIVQDTQNGIPYVRHELTTDVSVLEYREIVCVKNWDFLSYYFYDKLQSFVGRWNIVTDTLSSVRQTIVSSAELLKGQSLPKIGPPLIDYTIRRLEQDPNNKDRLVIEMPINIVYPLNYPALYLII